MNAARDEDDPPEDDAARDRRVYLDEMTRMQAGMAAMEVDTARLKRENWRMMAEKAEREAPQWLTIKRAADKAGCTNEWARAWAAKAVKAGRSNEATKTAGVGVSVNVTALIAAYRLRH
jgi:hypothetical protein